MGHMLLPVTVHHDVRPGMRPRTGESLSLISESTVAPLRCWNNNKEGSRQLWGVDSLSFHLSFAKRWRFHGPPSLGARCSVEPSMQSFHIRRQAERVARWRVAVWTTTQDRRSDATGLYSTSGFQDSLSYSVYRGSCVCHWDHIKPCHGDPLIPHPHKVKAQIQSRITCTPRHRSESHSSDSHPHLTSDAHRTNRPGSWLRRGASSVARRRNPNCCNAFRPPLIALVHHAD